MSSDPIFAAIHARRQAFAIYMAAVREDRPEAETDNLSDHECRATIDALETTPTTLAGLLAFCEFGAELSREAKYYSDCGIGDWTPGIPLGEGQEITVEERFFTTLERAARLLRPMEE